MDDINCFIMADWDRLIEYILEYLDRQNLSQAELARRADISPSQLSKILNRTSAPGREACEGLAHALKLPPDQVMQMAGLLPKRDARSTLIDRIVHLVEQMPPEEQERFVSLAEWTVEQQERKAKDAEAHP
jgi:transcriptional regulator with XRE-family HTH domain